MQGGRKSSLPCGNATGPRCYYQEHPAELKADLQKRRPRYVAVVEKPGQVTDDFVVRMNKMSRSVDEDIYVDFIWGVVTGFDAESACKGLEKNAQPLLLSKALEAVNESNVLTDGSAFERFRLMRYREIKESTPAEPGKLQKTGDYDRELQVSGFCQQVNEFRPQLLITQNNGNEGLFTAVKTGEGWENLLVKQRRFEIWHERDKKQEGLKPAVLDASPRFHLSVGVHACDPWLQEESIALAWQENGGVGGTVGCTHRPQISFCSWNTLKNLIASPGRYTCAEAYLLAQQQLMFHLHDYNPKLPACDCKLIEEDKDGHAEIKRLSEETGSSITWGHIFAMNERDRVVYLGDPAWNVRPERKAEYKDYTVTEKVKGKKCVLVIKTGKDFDLNRLSGNGLKEDHGEMNAHLDLPALPFTYLFSNRLPNPRLEGEWYGMVDENGIMLYDVDFAPNKTYEIVIKTQ